MMYEWESELDKYLFIHRNFICIIKRNYMGSLCGYVAIPKDHILYGKSTESDSFNDIEVHGGITWSDNFEDSKIWVIGFDCAHG